MKNIAAKIIIAFLLYAPISVNATGIPVLDSLNLSQNIMNTIETILQTLKQIEEYKTQLDQYQRQLDDAKNFDSGEFIWDEADSVVGDMLGVVGTVNTIKDMVEDVNFYNKALEDGITESEIDAMYYNAKSNIATENKSLDELIDTVDDQQIKIMTDAAKLVELQAKAEIAGETGQLQTLQAANMLGSHIGNQLLQIRALLIAQTNIEAAYRLKLNDKEAQQVASKKSVREGEFIPSGNQTF